MGHLLMSAKERQRLKVFARVQKGGLKLCEAAEILQISYRQAKRQFARYKIEGDQGLIHRGRGQPSNRRLPESFKQRVLARYQEIYPDFGPTLAAEKLEQEGMRVDHETLRLWLQTAGLWKRRRKRADHRSWRERRAHFGELVQLDGSHHEWFEKRGERCCLMTLIDDATSTRLSLFDKEETTEAAMLLLWGWIEEYGIPAALYVDGKNVYVPNEKLREEAGEEGREFFTQFGRACAKLGIRIIRSRSPQAHGRVERSNGVFQDRLVKELRLKGINSIEKANQQLDGFVDQLNARFAVEPRKPNDYHRSVGDLNLGSIFCIEQERSLSNDWIVRFENQYYQLQRQGQKSPTAKKVDVCKWLNGELHFVYRNRDIAYTRLPSRPEPATRKPKRPDKERENTKWIPPPDHPWRSFVFGSAGKER
jgi:transposase